MKIAICDDELVQREYISASVQRYFNEKVIPVCIQEYESAEELWFQFDLNSDIDIVLLDIQMAGMDGVSLAKKLRSKNEALSIIFITAMTDYIFEGFQVNAINYLLKPYEEEKLYDCLNKAMEQCNKQDSYLLLRVEKEIVKIKKDHIIRVESEGHYLYIFTGEQSYRVKRSMKEMESVLIEDNFFKISRSDILNLYSIARITPKEVALMNGDKIPVPKGRHHESSEAFMNCHFRRENMQC